jgi:diketogulonate reductase-like aldo/keto reductase
MDESSLHRRPKEAISGETSMHHVSANGAQIPALGFGTFDLPSARVQHLVEHALGVGYRHLDTAQMYGNEAAVGAGLRNAAPDRETVFLTTKIWPDHFARDALRQAADERLRLLGIDRVDLLLLHWPSKTVPLAETIEALNAVRAAGLTRHIGVSNFNTRLIEEAVRLSAAPLVTNQVEYHPYLDQTKVLAKLREHGMALTAYCPIARGRVADDPTLVAIGNAHGKSATQVALRWLIQQEGVIAIPRSADEARIEANLQVFDFALSAAEMARISGLGSAAGRLVDFALAPEWDD